MFRKYPKGIEDLVKSFLRNNALETPLLQRRLVSMWPIVVGDTINGYTESVDIRNQTLFVKLSSPAVRSDLTLRRTDLIAQLNNKVGATIINDIRFY